MYYEQTLFYTEQQQEIIKRIRVARITHLRSLSESQNPFLLEPFFLVFNSRYFLTRYHAISKIKKRKKNSEKYEKCATKAGVATPDPLNEAQCASPVFCRYIPAVQTRRLKLDAVTRIIIIPPTDCWATVPGGVFHGARLAPRNTYVI